MKDKKEKGKMKKRYLKKWVEVVLTIILLISFIILGAEIEKNFVVIKIISFLMLLISGYLLLKYKKVEE